MSAASPKPARTLSEAQDALSFETPLESCDSRWQDLSAARGDDGTVRLRRLFERKAAGKSLQAVFASHSGVGKTTELNRMTQELAQRYVCVYFEANVELDAFEFAMEDLLLALARAVEKTLRERKTPLPSALLGDVEKWFSETIVTRTLGRDYAAEIKSKAEAGGTIPFFASLLGGLSALLKVSSEHRKQVRSTLRRYPGELVRQINSLFAGAADVLAEEEKELLVIVDNMDRYSPRLIDELLIRGADRFKQLRCNFVLTPPISLILRPESQSPEAVFNTVIMPSVRLRLRNEPYKSFSGPGREALRAALGRRIDLHTFIPDPRAQDRLVWASGGGIRELLELAYEAVLDIGEPPIELENVERILSRQRHRIRDRIDVNGWLDTLVAIARTKRLTPDQACRDVLFQRLAFLYDGKVWYDVHPLVTEIPDFANSYSALSG